MEQAPLTSPPPPSNSGAGCLGTVVSVIVAFLLGIYVGLHPNWIPIHFNGATETPIFNSTPGSDNRVQDDENHALPQGTPATTEPATMP